MSNTTIMQLDRLETIAGELRTDEGMRPDGSLYDASHAIIELAYGIKNALIAEREKVQILRDALRKLQPWIEHLQELEDEPEFRNFWESLAATEGSNA